jgi:hypothetical protein
MTSVASSTPSFLAFKKQFIIGKMIFTKFFIHTKDERKRKKQSKAKQERKSKMNRNGR